MPTRVPHPGGDMLTVLRHRGPALFVDGRWQAPRSGRSAETIDPSTESAIASYAIAGPEDVDDAVRAAARAQPGWASLPAAQRGAAFARLAELIVEHAEQIAYLDALDAGLPVRRMDIDIQGALRALEGWPGLALSLRGEVLPDPDVLHYTRHAPYGVVAKIVAYNHPFLFAVKGSLAALIAGNTVVLKPADQTPLSALLLADLVGQAFPPGVMNILTGDGQTGAALVSHPLVRRIAFTGSARTGALIQRGAAADDTIRTLSLELGGKNAMVVFADVDVARVAAEVVKAMNLRANQGQSCGSTSRLFVHRDVYERFCAELAAVFSALTLGPAYDPDADMGPLISAEHAARVRASIAQATADGGQVLTGGPADARVPATGFFVAPTALTGVPPDSAAAQEEIFGPVVCVFPWSDRDTMLAQVNSVEYGLTASIWTRDVSAALRLADEIEAGYVWVNDSTTHYWGTPFGGWKNSGVGREESLSELLGYLQVKSVHVSLRE